MKRILSLAFIAVISGSTVFGQAKLVEKVTRKGTELVIPYQKYVLNNGLTVIVHEDHSDPVVHVDVTYHVGSAREEIGKSGFAHFFEHMMFQGSDNVADEQHFKVITESGGTLNGSTNRDRTNYYETIPSNQLEKIIWLEADRMGFLLDAVTQKKFEVQRATVKNERGQNYDNRPYGLASEYVSKSLYPYGHPYSWLTIGYIEELNAVNVNDLKNFFLRWYGPNNATLTVGGDVTAAEVVKLAEKYFGTIPRGPEVKNMTLPSPVLKSDRYVSYEDNYIRQPLMSLTFPGVPSYHKDEAALSILTSLIGRGNNSIFYQNFVKTRKAAQASMGSSNSELSGEISISVVPFPGQTLQDMKKLVEKSLKDFEAKGVSDEDMIRLKGSSEAGYINALASVSGKVSLLAAAQTYTGNPNQIQISLNAIQSVTKEDVMRVYNQYVKDKPAVILSILPKGQGNMRVADDNFKVDQSGYVAPNYGYAGLKYQKAKDSFDRSKVPTSGKNPVIEVPKYWTAQTPNGIKMIGSENNEIPSVSISISIKGGDNLLLNNPKKAGLAGIATSLMGEDTQNYTAESFSAELQKLGSNVGVFSSGDAVIYSVSSLTKNIDQTLALLKERMFKPKFTQDALDRVKKQNIQGLINAKTRPASIASDVFEKILYGNENPRVEVGSGTEKTIETITLADVEDFYKQNMAPNVTSIVIVGDIKEDVIKAKLSFLNDWEKKDVKLLSPVAGKPTSKTILYLVDVPKAAQSEIRIGYVNNLKYDATGEFYKVGLMNYNLGGAFNSRINLNLREDKGWTYGARSGFSADEYDGSFDASAGVKAAATDSSVVEFIKEITNYQKSGIKADELAFMKLSIGQADARRYETNGQKAGFLSRILTYNLKPDFVATQTNILNNIKKEEIDILAKKYLDVNKMVILVVGDKALTLPGLQKLGYEIIELDADGNRKM